MGKAQGEGIDEDGKRKGYFLDEYRGGAFRYMYVADCKQTNLTSKGRKLEPINTTGEVGWPSVESVASSSGSLPGSTAAKKGLADDKADDSLVETPESDGDIVRREKLALKAGESAITKVNKRAEMVGVIEKINKCIEEMQNATIDKLKHIEALEMTTAQSLDMIEE